MVLPVFFLVAIPIFLGIVTVSPFEVPEEPSETIATAEPDVNILHFFLMAIWLLLLVRVLLQLKKGTFKVTNKY